MTLFGSVFSRVMGPSYRNSYSRISWVLFPFLVTIGLSMETPNPYRDFSKLRLEGGHSPPTSTTPRDFYYSTGSSATEDSGVIFKPSSNDNMDTLTYNNNEDEDQYEQNPSTQSHTNRPSPLNDDDNSQNHHHNGERGPSGPGDVHSGGGMDDKGQHPYEIGKNSMSSPDGPEDMFFIPAPPSPNFIAEIEYDSATGTLQEPGAGGLFDGDQDTDYFYNNPDSDQNNILSQDHLSQAQQSPQMNHLHQNNEHNQDRRAFAYGDNDGGSNHGSGSGGLGGYNGGGYGNDRLNEGYEHISHAHRNSDYGDYN